MNRPLPPPWAAGRACGYDTRRTMASTGWLWVRGNPTWTPVHQPPRAARRVRTGDYVPDIAAVPRAPTDRNQHDPQRHLQSTEWLTRPTSAPWSPNCTTCSRRSRPSCQSRSGTSPGHDLPPQGERVTRPWHPEAGMVLMVIHEEARRLEASLRTYVAGHLGRRRGGSDANTAAALNAIAHLAHGVPSEAAAHARRIIERWIRSARQIRATSAWRSRGTIPVPQGAVPPACPYCRTYSLRMRGIERRIRCINPRCWDHEDRHLKADW